MAACDRRSSLAGTGYASLVANPFEDQPDDPERDEQRYDNSDAYEPDVTSRDHCHYDADHDETKPGDAIDREPHGLRTTRVRPLSFCVSQ